MDTNHEPSDAIDRAIDDAVRALTAAEPDGGFTDRVMARLATPRRAWTGMLRLAAATAAVIVVALTATWLARVRDGSIPAGATVAVSQPGTTRPTTTSPAAPGRASGEDGAVRTAPPEPATVSGTGDVFARRVEQTGRGTARPERQVASRGVPAPAAGATTVDIAPLRAIEQIVPAAITTNSVDTDDIITAPIAIDAIQVHPLSSNH